MPGGVTIKFVKLIGCCTAVLTKICLLETSFHWCISLVLFLLKKLALVNHNTGWGLTYSLEHFLLVVQLNSTTSE